MILVIEEQFFVEGFCCLFRIGLVNTKLIAGFSFVEQLQVLYQRPFPKKYRQKVIFCWFIVCRQPARFTLCCRASVQASDSPTSERLSLHVSNMMILPELTLRKYKVCDFVGRLQ